MPRNVGCYVLKLGGQAESLEHPDDADEVAVADLTRENLLRINEGGTRHYLSTSINAELRARTHP
jgi:hypothetical protein